MAWVNQQPGVTSVIIGAKTVAQLEDNIAATTFTLSADELNRLDVVSALIKEYPQWMVERQGSDRILSR